MVFHSPDRYSPQIRAGHPVARRLRSRVAHAERIDAGAMLAILLVLFLSLVCASVARSESDGASAAAPIAVPAVPEASVANVPPSDLRDLDAWIAYRTRAHVPMLSEQARVFYRRGLLAWRAGQDSEAVRLVRGAAALDPTYAAPHGTLAAWYLTREPSEALQQAASLLQILKRDFLLQLAAAGNATFLLAQTLFYALLGLGMLLIVLHHAELRHMWQERLERVVSPISARTWAWAFLLIPFLAGFGLALPTLFLLGMLWAVLRNRERVLVVGLAAITVLAPGTAYLTGRMTLPLENRSAPYFGVGSLENETPTSARQASLAEAAGAHPENGYLAFGHAWVARRNGDVGAAEHSYRSVLERWPDNDRAMNNLGNVLAMQGRFDDALALYDQAMKLRPDNAAPFFNASQVHTRRFEYREASELVSRAAALDFELVKTYQGESVGGDLPLADQWLAPRTFWNTLLSAEASRAARAQLPPGWRNMIEASGWPFAGVTLALTVAAMVIGMRWQKKLPLRPCSNCGHVLCRRCSERKRELALCRSCATQAGRAESHAFSDALLMQRKRRARRFDRSVRTALASLLPGYGALSFGHIGSAVALAIPAAFLTAWMIGVRGPFGTEHEFGLVGVPETLGVAAPWAALYALSILGFVLHQSRLDAQESVRPARPRVAQPTHLPSRAA
jgi:Flp pilus assembly protein TadD